MTRFRNSRQVFHVFLVGFLGTSLLFLINYLVPFLPPDVGAAVGLILISILGLGIIVAKCVAVMTTVRRAVDSERDFDDWQPK